MRGQVYMGPMAAIRPFRMGLMRPYGSRWFSLLGFWDTRVTWMVFSIVEQLDYIMINKRPWDFDASFVRDPRYPQAAPRIAATAANSDAFVHAVALRQPGGFGLRAIAWSGHGAARATEIRGSDDNGIEADGPLALADAEEGAVVLIALAAGTGQPLAPVGTASGIAGNSYPITGATPSPTQRGLSWSALKPVGLPLPAGQPQPRPKPEAPRRARCLAATTCASLGDEGALPAGPVVCVCYVARDLSLQILLRQARRLQAQAGKSQPVPQQDTHVWLGPIRLVAPGSSPELTVHAFSNLAILPWGDEGDSGAIFALSDTSRLTITAFPLTSRSGWQRSAPPAAPNGDGATRREEEDKARVELVVFGHHVIDPPKQPGDPPTLLQGTALAAGSPSLCVIIVFGVSRSLCLVYWWSVSFAGLRQERWQSGAPAAGPSPSWIGPEVVSSQLEEQLFAHTRPAVTTTGPYSVLVAAISRKGVPLLYNLVS